MQVVALRKRLRALRTRLSAPRKRRPVSYERTAGLRHRRIGLVGVLVVIASLLTTGVAYLSPTGKSSYTAHLTSSGGVRGGDEVRIAGIPVGKVESVRLDGTVVAMTFNIDRSVPVGSESTLEIKLLTPLGGHYVALDPKGPIPLGHNVIPPQRTTTPFEINDIVQKATPIVEKVDGQVIHDTFSEIAAAANAYPESLRDVIGSAHQLTTTLSRSTQEFHRGLDFVNEFSSAFVAGRKQLVTLFQQLDQIGEQYTSKSVDIVEFFTLLDELARIVDRVVTFYGRELAPTINAIDDIFDTLFTHPERLGQAAEGLGQIVNIVGPMLSGNGVKVDESDRMIPGQDLCLPSIMRHC